MLCLYCFFPDGTIANECHPIIDKTEAMDCFIDERCTITKQQNRSTGICSSFIKRLIETNVKDNGNEKKKNIVFLLSHGFRQIFHTTVYLMNNCIKLRVRRSSS